MSAVIPNSWQMVKLGACLLRRRETLMPATSNEPFINLVGLEDIEGEGLGGVTIQRKRPYEVESLKTKFFAGDILYGKLRPYLNKVAIAPIDGLCSTEIWALTGRPIIDLKYAVYFLSSSFFVDRVSSLTKGANLPRLDTEAFDSIDIPLPPLSEQKRIVEILQEAEEIRRLRVEAEDKVTELTPALFREMTASQDFNLSSPLGQFFSMKPNYGTMTPAVSDQSGVVCLRVGNIQGNRIDLSDTKYVPHNSFNIKRHIVKTGDIILARAIASIEHLGKAVVVTQEQNGYAFDSHLMRLRLKQDKLLPDFLQVYLYTPFGRHVFLKQARQSAVQFNVNVEEVSRIPVPNIDIRHQKQIVEAIHASSTIHSCLQSIDTLVNKLTTSLSVQVFSGQLTSKWREANKEKLATEAWERDVFLRRAGATISISHQSAIDEAETVPSPNISRDCIYEDLNHEHKELFTSIKRLVSSINYGSYFTAQFISESMEGSLRRNPQAIEGHLAVFVARGLLIPISIEEQTADTGEFVFGNAYRLPTDEFKPTENEEIDSVISDYSRLQEMDRLATQLEQEQTLA
jgi:type I restriction enzyme, S subunit